MRLIAAVLTLGALLGLGAASAEAYPQFQFSTENSRCNLCHFSPVGGGLITGYGRSEAEDLSLTSGNGDFLHGLWEPPAALRLGGDYRGAFIARNSWDELELAGFPMQADLYAIASVADVSLAVTVGVRGAARNPGEDALLERLVSREHYLMWQPKSVGPYVRAGRFMLPFGLRLVDHTAYTRRYLGLHTLEEVFGVSGGTVQNDWEVHATAHISPFIWDVDQTSGGALLYERRIGDDRGAYGTQARVAVGPDDTRYLAGGIFKWWFEGPQILVLSELDLGLQRVGGVQTRGQLAGYLGATWIPYSWLLVGSSLQRFDEDFTLDDTERDAIDLTIQFFPRSHWELVLMGKLELQGQDWSDPNGFGMFMLHYYL